MRIQGLRALPNRPKSLEDTNAHKKMQCTIIAFFIANFSNALKVYLTVEQHLTGKHGKPDSHHGGFFHSKGT